MKIGQLVFTKKMTAGVSVFNRSFHSKVEELGEKVIDFAPLDEEEYDKIPQIGEALKYTTLIEHLDEARKCDLIFGSNTTSISYINRKIPLVTAYHSVPGAILNEIPSDFERISEPFVFEQYIREAEKLGIPPEKDSWRNVENINLADKYIAQNCKNLVAVSQRAKAELMNFYNIPSEKIQVIENGVQDYWFKKEKCEKCKKITEKWEKTGKPTMVYLTRVSRGNTLNSAVKGIDRALAAIKHTGENINKVVISLTHETVIDKFKKLFNDAGAEFIANHPHKHLPHLIQKADICIQTSRYEGFGYVLAEEMASQAACVAFPSGFLPEIVKNRENVILVNNTEEMIQAVKELAEDENLRKKLGRNARKAITTRYTLKQMAKDYIDYFKKVLTK